jgi:hypothetical protein
MAVNSRRDGQAPTNLRAYRSVARVPLLFVWRICAYSFELREWHFDWTMEDDLTFCDDMAQRWPGTLSALPDDWSIFCPAHDDLGDGISLVDPAKRIVGAHLMVFRDSIAPRIISGLETIKSRPGGHPLGGPMHVDGAYSTIRKQNPDIKTYKLSPVLGYQRPSHSDISPNFFDKVPAIRPLLTAVRKWKTVQAKRSNPLATKR